MKRCPECSFIYEDDQHLCDMDGKALVHDGGAVPGKVETRPGELPKASRSKRLVLQAIAGIALVAILLAVYYILTRSRTPPPSDPAPAPIADRASSGSTRPEQYAATSVLDLQTEKPAAPARADASPSALNTETQETDTKTTSAEKASDPRLTISKRLPPLRSIPPLPTLPAAKPQVNKSNSKATPATVIAVTPEPAKTATKPTTAVNKKESRLGSFLKRTGRVLAKPFKF